MRLVNSLPVVMVVLCGCLFLGACQGPDAVSGSGADSKRDLLGFLIEQNEVGREKIKSYSFTLEADQQYKKNLSTRTAEVKSRGDYLWCTHLQIQLNIAGELMLERESRMVVNDRFSAIWKGPMARTTDQYLHHSFDTMDSRRKSTIRTNMPHQFMGYCFGSPVMSFREQIAAYPERNTWRAIETENADGKKIYEIWRRPVNKRDGQTGIEVKWVLDPQKGYLATESIAYWNNAIWLQRVIEVEEVATGVWFPVAFRQERRDGVGDLEVTFEETIQLKNVVVNKDIPDEQFEFDALNLQEDMPEIIVLRIGFDGGKVPYVYYEGRLVPQRAVLRSKLTGDVEAEIEKFENEMAADTKN